MILQRSEEVKELLKLSAAAAQENYLEYEKALAIATKLRDYPKEKQLEQTKVDLILQTTTKNYKSRRYGLLLKISN